MTVIPISQPSCAHLWGTDCGDACVPALHHIDVGAHPPYQLDLSTDPQGEPVTKLLQYAKAVAAALVSFAAVAVFVWQDKAVSLDEMNALWLAFVPVLTALGVWAAPKNQPG